MLKRRCIWRTTDVKSLKLTMSVFAITISNIRRSSWRNQILDKKEEQTKSKDWCKESCKPGQRGRQSEGSWGEGAIPGHEEEKWSLQGQLVSSIILIHVVRILWNQSKVCLHRHLIAEAALCTIPLPGKSLMDNRESFAPTGIHALYTTKAFFSMISSRRIQKQPDFHSIIARMSSWCWRVDCWLVPSWPNWTIAPIRALCTI